MLDFNKFNKLTHAVLLYGNHIAGKTNIYNCLKYVRNIIVKQNTPFLFVDADVELNFRMQGKICQYRIVTDCNGIVSEYISFNNITNKSEKKHQNSVITTQTHSDIYEWFSQIDFIDSSYEYSIDYIGEIDKNIDLINSICGKYVNYIYWLETDYPKIYFFKQSNNIYMNTPQGKIPIKEVQKSTVELISLLPKIENISYGKKHSVLIIDDITYIAKQRFAQVILENFIRRIPYRSKQQLLATSNDDSFFDSRFMKKIKLM